MRDLIDRQAAIDAIQERINQVGYTHNKSVLSIMQTVMELPSAEPERKMGKWIPVDVGDCCYRCSECGFMRDAYLLDVGCYCPQCGLSMTGEQQ